MVVELGGLCNPKVLRRREQCVQLLLREWSILVVHFKNTVLHLKCHRCTINLKITRVYKYLLTCVEHLLCTWLYLKCFHTFLIWFSQHTRLGDGCCCTVIMMCWSSDSWVTFPESQQVTGGAGVQSLSRRTA